LGREAEGVVSRRLRTEHDSVPCPQCGHYQMKMIGPAREETFGWVLRLGLLLGVLLGAACFVGGAAVTHFGDAKLKAVLRNAINGMMCPAAIGIPVAALVVKSRAAGSGRWTRWST
jgi:hypothetical protein